MIMKYINRTYLKMNKGNGYVCGLVDALHAAPPEADIHTDTIAQKVAQKTGCAVIIATVSRTIADLNRSPDGANEPAVREYRSSIREAVEYLDILDHVQNRITKPYLHLCLHGMKDDHYGPFAIEVGTARGQSCSAEIRDWFQESLKSKAEALLPKIEVAFDQIFVGDRSIALHRNGDGGNYEGYGPHFHTLQIEISRTIRSKCRSQISELFAHLIKEFQSRFVNGN